METRSHADTPAFVLGEVLNLQPSSFTGTRGWQFRRIGTETIEITRLGVFDDGGDGLVNSHQVGLWRSIDSLSGTLLASATVPAGMAASLEGGYRWVSIPPVVIPSSPFLFIVAAQYSAGDADDQLTPRPSTYAGSGAFQFAPEIYPYYGVGRLEYGAALPFPARFTGGIQGQPGEMFFEPNLQYSLIPEPSASVLLVLGSGFLFGARPWRKQGRCAPRTSRFVAATRF